MLSEMFNIVWAFKWHALAIIGLKLSYVLWLRWVSAKW
jgi:hypothetical protein